MHTKASSRAIEAIEPSGFQPAIHASADRPNRKPPTPLIKRIPLAAKLALFSCIPFAATMPAHAVSAAGNIADHTLQGVPSMVVRPGSWRETNDTRMRQAADALVSTGLAAKGWNIVAVDDDWMVRTNCTDWDTASTPVPNCSGGRDGAGHPIASPSKYPQGIQATINYVHSKGLKFGIYTDGGSKTCDGGAAMNAASGPTYFTADANYFASIGVDYIKSDYCYNINNTSNGWPLTTDNDATIAVDAYRQTAEAVNAANTAYGTRMVLTPSPAAYFNWHNDATGTAAFQKVMNGLVLYAQQWRVGGDNGGSTWSAMVTTANQAVGTAAYARAGHHNDLDQLAMGKGSMTTAQGQSEFSIWAVLAAPLNIQYTTANGFTPQVVSDAGNTDVIAISQDQIGAQGKRIADDANTSVFTKPLANGDYAVLLLNKSTTAQTISTTGLAAGTSATQFSLTDLWSKAVTTSTSTISASVPATSAVLYRLHPTSNSYSAWRQARNATSISDDDASTAACFDSACGSFSSDALAAAGVVAGGSVTDNGQTFTGWVGGGAGQLDSIVAQGQTLAYSAVGRNFMGFLGASNGGDVSGTVTLNYSDGTSGTFTLGFPDWQTSNPTAFGDTTAITLPRRNTQTQAQVSGTFVISHAKIPLPAGKSVVSIVLPNQPALRIFSITTSQ
jgi:alpha-galactosidase